MWIVLPPPTKTTMLPPPARGGGGVTARFAPYLTRRSGARAIRVGMSNGNRGSAGVYLPNYRARPVGLACVAIGRSAVGPASAARALSAKGALSRRRPAVVAIESSPPPTVCCQCCRLPYGRSSSALSVRVVPRVSVSCRANNTREKSSSPKGRAAVIAFLPTQWSSSCEYSSRWPFPYNTSGITTVPNKRHVTLALWHDFSVGVSVFVYRFRVPGGGGGDLCAHTCAACDFG